MRELVYYMAVSIDGRIAGPGGEFDFYPEGEGAQFDEYRGWMLKTFPETVPTLARQASGIADVPNENIDTLVMGLGTYRSALDMGVTSPYAHLRQYVVSSTLRESPDPAVTVVHGDPLGLVRSLKREEGKDIWLCGGGKLAGAVWPEVDRLVIKSYPVVAGDGIPLVDGKFDPTRFDVTDRRVFGNGVVVSWFSRK
ncbi:dihydrofolate reductase family protein [Amycolatopsis endophytica]|uniref:Dihydrofolate reductase n=1 Tax=Amycolatopsis endophytica TaxID=860233 RepID=A0A853B2J4_9PSEU|nr:dihydrofolate reductase family protein [Amycolatopsis endophytica]NYI89230.1 dihydrofolate reductase [Amycolatopsis endophytica]